MNQLKHYCFVLFLLILFQGFSQQFADPEFYLVDSLVYTKLERSDQKLLDSTLRHYHNSTDKPLETINYIVETSWDDRIWPKYNQWILNQLIQKKQRNEVLDSTEQILFANCLINHGYYFRLIGQIDSALYYYQKSYNEYDRLDQKEGLAYCLNNMGVIYDSQGNLAKALECYHSSLKIQEEIGDKEGIANSYSNIGEVHHEQDDIDQALEFLNKSLNLQIEINNKRGEAMLKVKIADIYREQNKLNEAISLFYSSLQLNETIEDIFGIASSLREVGVTYQLLNKTDSALINYKKAHEYFLVINDKEELAKSFNNLGAIYLDLNKTDLAYKNAQKAHKMAKELQFADLIASTALTLSRVYEQFGDNENSLKLFKTHIRLRDSIHNDQNKKMAIRMQLQSDYEKQKVLDDIQKEKEIAIANEAEKRQTFISYALGFVGVLIAVFLVIIFNRLKVTREQKVLIEEANEELNQTNEEILAQRDQIEVQKDIIEEKHGQLQSSIHYAKNIQQALLPKLEELKTILPDHFVFFKPRDIVSGDFYWIDIRGEFIYIAAADCTGHGVPGAFMSMLGMSFLNQINRMDGYQTPGEILDILRDNVKRELKQEGKDNEAKDGMDIALIRINIKTKELDYAGAYNPLYIINKNRTAPPTNIAVPFRNCTFGWELKATKRPIGIAFGRKNVPFHNHTIRLEDGDLICIFSDGYADQFGGEKESKFSYGKFKELLTENYENDCNNIANTLEDQFKKWKGNVSQTDDVCVIGIKF